MEKISPNEYEDALKFFLEERSPFLNLKIHSEEINTKERSIRQLSDEARQESSELLDLFPICIIEDRYNGTYSGGAWIAFRNAEDLDINQLLDEGPSGGHKQVTEFWEKNQGNKNLAVGPTPNQAVKNLYLKSKDV